MQSKTNTKNAQDKTLSVAASASYPLQSSEKDAQVQRALLEAAASCGASSVSDGRDMNTGYMGFHMPAGQFAKFSELAIRQTERILSKAAKGLDIQAKIIRSQR